MVNFPTSIDALTNPSASDALNSVTVPHATQHANLNDIVEALEAKVGIDGSVDTDSLDYKVSQKQAACEVKDTSFTAINGGRYNCVATLTITDPSPVEGQGFEVFARNGTITVGGTAYTVPGTKICRMFHSGSWSPNFVEYPVTGGEGTAGQVVTSNGAGVAPSFQAATATDSTKLPLAGGTMTGDITLDENASIAQDPALSADGKFTGETVTGTAGATLAFGDLVYLDPTDSRWEKTDANAVAAADGDARGIIGICVLAAAADGSATKILLRGMVRADAKFPALTINAPVYVSETAGEVVVAQPTTADVVIRVVGFGFTADSMYFNPSSDYITHT